MMRAYDAIGKRPTRCLPRATAWTTLVVSCLLASCGQSDDSTELDDAMSREPPRAPVDFTSAESVLDEWKSMRESPLSETEERAVLTLLASGGIAEERVEFHGRMAALDGDSLLYVDDLLQGVGPGGAVPKGRVHPNPSFETFHPQLCWLPGQQFADDNCPEQPDDLANPSGNNLFWRRPDTTKLYYLVAAAGSPAYFTGPNGLITKAANKIQHALGSGALGDCLNFPNALFSVMTQADYDRFAVKGENYAIFFFPSTSDPSNNICGGGRACATQPRFRDTLTTRRMAFGPGIGINIEGQPNNEPDGVANEAGEESVGVVIHEILHTMGFAHSNAPSAESVVVPGTLATPPEGSVMVIDGQARTPGWNDWHPTIPQSDLNMLRKLYGPGDSTCAYTDAFRTITPCGPNGVQSGNVCCMASCGTCGGSGCGSRPGRADGCCTARIIRNDVGCGPNAPPCVVKY